VSASTPDVLACEEARDFWISWHDGTLKAGTGRVYNQNLFFQPVVDKNVDVKYVGFTTYEGLAEWNIKDTVGKEYMSDWYWQFPVCTSPSLQNDHCIIPLVGPHV
jgi:hypothetical protein